MLRMRWLLPPLHLYRRLDRGADGLRGRLRREVSGLLCAALSDAEQQRLTTGLYDRPGPKRAQLFAWEQPWFASLPPGCVLVGGAGDGREVAALRAAGHPVHALEPAPRLAARVEAERVFVADYGDLAAGRVALEAPYAAVVFGWGSFTHVLRAADRRRLVAAAAAACPDGPILASFWLQGSAQDAGEGRLGHALGRAVGRLRGLPPAPGRQFAPWCGFGARLTKAEVEALGRAVNRRVVWGGGPYPHVGWWPR